MKILIYNAKYCITPHPLKHASNFAGMPENFQVMVFISISLGGSVVLVLLAIISLMLKIYFSNLMSSGWNISQYLNNRNKFSFA